MSAPRRLLEDPSASSVLRDDLRVAATAEPRYDSERGLLALQAALAIGHAAPLGEAARQAAAHAGGSVAPAAAKAGAASALAGVGGKLTVAVLAVGLGVAGVATWRSQTPSAPAPRPAPTAPAVAAPAPQPAPTPAVAAEPAPALAPAAPAPEPLAPAAPQLAPTHRAAAHGLAKPIDRDLAYKREIEHLARVKALMESDPRGAFELAQQGNRTLSSMLRQERDGLSVIALDAAGEHAAAVSLAHKFLRRYPKSPLLARVAAIVGKAAATP